MENKPNITFDQFLASNARLHDKLSEALDNSLTKQKETKEKAEKKLQEDLTYGAASDLASGIYNQNKKAKVAANEYLFREEFTKKMLGKILTHIIDEALLFDTKAYKAYNENYLTEINNRVNKLLESENINLNIQNENTKAILEAINEFMPINYGAYKLLSEADLSVYAKQALANNKITGALNSLVSDVRERVADIVTKDIEQNNQAVNDIQKINNVVSDINAEHDAEFNKLAQKDVNDSVPQLDDPNIIPVDDPNHAQIDQVDNVSQETQTAQEPAQTNEPAVVQEAYAQGIIESIVLNEAKIMLEQDGTYNKDYALANALKFVTILEAFNATDLMNISEETYNRIVNKSVIYKPETRVLKAFTPATPIIENVKPVNQDRMPNGMMSFDNWKKQKEANNKGLNEELKVSKEVKYTKNGQILTQEKLEEKLEDMGYNFRYDNFYDVIKVNGWKKC